MKSKTPSQTLVSLDSKVEKVGGYELTVDMKEEIKVKLKWYNDLMERKLKD